MQKNAQLFPIQKMANVMRVSKSGYYAYLKRSLSKRNEENHRLAQEIRSIYQENRGLYGSPRIHAMLLKKGFSCSRKRVARLMKTLHLRAIMNKKFNHRKKIQLESAPDYLEQKFEADSPNSIWAADITYIKTSEGWLYLATILDLFSRKIVGFAMQEHMRAELVESALKQAYFRRRPQKKLIHHSDRGSQYTSKSFKALCTSYLIKMSMSQGSCYDNAAMESFFHTLKTELIHLQKFKTRKEAKMAIFEYIEHFYNRERLHSTLRYVSPEQFEQNYENQKFCVSSV